MNLENQHIVFLINSHTPYHMTCGDIVPSGGHLRHSQMFTTRLPVLLRDWPAYIKDITKLVPEEYRSSAVFQIDAEGDGDDGADVHIELRYARPQTAEEAVEAAKAVELQRSALEKYQRAEYEKLKAIFDPQ